MMQEITGKARLHALQLLVAAAAALCLALAPLGAAVQPALAAPDDAEAAQGQQDTAADAGAGGQQPSSSSSSSGDAAAPATERVAGVGAEGGVVVGNDVFLSAQAIENTGIAIPANLFAGAQSIDLDGGTVGADAFVSAETIRLGGLVVGNNLFAAGNNLTLSGIEAKTLFIVGNNLDIDADADDVHAAGRTVFLKGVFEGDVDVNAQNVVIDPYIVVRGTLNVTADQEPTIASTAKIGSFNYNQSEYDGGWVLAAAAAIGSAAWLWGLLMLFLGMLLLGVLMLVAMRTEVVDAAGRLVKERPLALFVSGLVTVIVLPLVVVGLFASGVGWTVALALVFLAFIVTMFAGTFTAISLGRTFFGRIGKWISSIIMIAVFALLLSLPIVDFVIGALSTLYFAGSVIQGWWVWRRGPGGAAGGSEPDDMDFTVPRGSHVTVQPTAQAVPPVPSVQNIPSTDPADYRPRGWNE